MRLLSCSFPAAQLLCGSWSRPPASPGGSAKGLPWAEISTHLLSRWGFRPSLRPSLPGWFPRKRHRLSGAAMGKSLIKIHTRVRVELRLTNHCLRPLSVRVLRMGPRLQGRLLTAVPPSPLGAASGQGDQLQHLQGNKAVLCCAVPLAQIPPTLSPQNNRFDGGARQVVVDSDT